MIAIHQLASLRHVLDHLVQSVAPTDLFRVPRGFSNHVAWNAAHVVVTQQILHYRLSSNEPHLDAHLIERYQKGTGPEAGDEASFRATMAFSHEGVQRLTEDYAEGRFSAFTPYRTSAGVELTSIEDALTFNNAHEGIHIGYIMALRKALAADPA